MERFITLAQHLRELQNFNSLMAILSGLSNSAVFRLAMTKEEISKSAEKVSLHKMTPFYLVSNEEIFFRHGQS